MSEPGPRTNGDADPYCTAPWTSAFIRFDGRVRPCCFSEAESSLGDLREQTFEEIWNGEGYRNLRRQILAGKVPEMCQGCVANKRYQGLSVFSRFEDNIRDVGDQSLAG